LIGNNRNWVGLMCLRLVLVNDHQSTETRWEGNKQKLL